MSERFRNALIMIHDYSLTIQDMADELEPDDIREILQTIHNIAEEALEDEADS